MSDSTVPNPELGPASPAIERTDEGYVLDPKRVPAWRGCCPSCKWLHAIARATDSRQVWTDKDGNVKRRLFVLWQRFCLVGPEALEIADDDIAWCSKWEQNPDGGAFAKLIGAPIGNTPFAEEDK